MKKSSKKKDEGSQHEDSEHNNADEESYLSSSSWEEASAPSTRRGNKKKGSSEVGPNENENDKKSAAEGKKKKSKSQSKDSKPDSSGHPKAKKSIKKKAEDHFKDDSENSSLGHSSIIEGTPKTRKMRKKINVEDRPNISIGPRSSLSNSSKAKIEGDSSHKRDTQRKRSSSLHRRGENAMSRSVHNNSSNSGRKERTTGLTIPGHHSEASPKIKINQRRRRSFNAAIDPTSPLPGGTRQTFRKSETSIQLPQFAATGKPTGGRPRAYSLSLSPSKHKRTDAAESSSLSLQGFEEEMQRKGDWSISKARIKLRESLSKTKKHHYSLGALDEIYPPELSSSSLSLGSSTGSVGGMATNSKTGA